MNPSISPGTLLLIPTPIVESLPLEPIALEILKTHALDESALILVEEHKVARIRWLQWGLPREAISRFVLFNEHNQKDSIPEILQALKSGKRAFLMSDGGLPAFCDPGQLLVSACHDQHIKVSASPFPNSIALAVALSGFSHSTFHFAGFLPADSHSRKQSLEHIAQNEENAIVLMDTPYRLQALLKDLSQSAFRNRKIFLATGLNSSEERLYRGVVSEILQKIGELNKVEFVIMIQGKSR